MKVVYTGRHRLHATNRLWWDGAPFVTEEIPARAELIREALQNSIGFEFIEPQDHGLAPITAVHDEDFVSFLRGVYRENMQYFGDPEPVIPHAFAVRFEGRKPTSFLGLRGYYGFGAGTPIAEGTWEAAYWSAQCALTAADALLAGDRAAYALCRPPGHHAAVDLYGGSCFLNNAAAAARYLTRTGGRVAILDIDYHHGNGTQAIFYRDPAVIFCSLHAHPDDDYPYFWGYADEQGQGIGAGTNWNFPLPGKVDDGPYLESLEKAIAVIQAARVNYLVVSLGLDILQGDPVGGFNITMRGLEKISARIHDLQLPTVLVQEGGYRMDCLGEAAARFLNVFQ